MPPQGPVTLQVDGRTLRKDVVDLQLLLVIDFSTVDYSQIVDPVRDIGIRTVDGIDLPFEIEVWDPPNDSLLWVRVPRLIAGAVVDSLVVTSGVGANHATGTAADTWQGVGLVVHDVPSVEVATAANVSSVPGWIARGIRFTESRAGRVEFSDRTLLPRGTEPFSLEMWIYPEDGTVATEPRVIEAPDAFRLGRLSGLPGVPEVVQFQLDIQFQSTGSYLNLVLVRETWNQVVYTYDGRTLLVYHNGRIASVDEIPAPSGLTGNTGPLVLGDTNSAFVGILDEVRIRDHALSIDAVWANYLSQSRALIQRR